MPSESQLQIASEAESSIRRLRSPLLSRMSSACTRDVLSSENRMVDLSKKETPLRRGFRWLTLCFSRTILDITIYRMDYQFLKKMRGRPYVGKGHRVVSISNREMNLRLAPSTLSRSSRLFSPSKQAPTAFFRATWGGREGLQ